MSPARSPIPRGLRGSAFTAAGAARFGVGRAKLRGQQYRRLHRGVYRVAEEIEAPSRFVEARVLAAAQNYAPLLRDGEAFSHTTALLLYGAPIDATDELHTTAHWSQSPSRRAGVRGHRTRIPFRPGAAPYGLACVPPELALVQCGRLLPFRELVVAIDALILPQRGLRGRAVINRERLAVRLREISAPGIDRVRAALEVSRVGAESRYETLMRFEAARAGIDHLELQGDIFDEQGMWIGRFDLVDRVTRKIAEFDGEQHRLDRRQYLKDLRRLELVRTIDFDVLRLHAENFAPGELAATRLRLCSFFEVNPRSPAPYLARYFAESTDLR